MNISDERFNKEWIALNAVREMLKISTRGNIEKSRYEDAFEVGGEIYPELLGEEVSLLRRERLSSLTKEYIQKAEFLSIRENSETKPIVLVKTDIAELESLLELSVEGRINKGKDQLQKKLNQLRKTKEELEPEKHTENEILFRDVYRVERNLPEIDSIKSARTFRLKNHDNLRIRILHPDKPEHITGADLIYEYHYRGEESVSIIFIQYKIWEEERLYLSDDRLSRQLRKMKAITCDKGLCNYRDEIDCLFRFPFCSSFLRPTDALQKVDQALISRGEYVPICKLEHLKVLGSRGGIYLDRESIKEVSLNSYLFEELFNNKRLGSRKIKYSELAKFYKDTSIINSSDKVVIYAQDYKY